MRKVDPQIEQMAANFGYTRKNDTEAGAWFSRGTDAVLVSGYMVFVRVNGMTRAFPIDKALMLGMNMMERLARMRPQPFSGKEDRTNYSFPTAKEVL